MSSLSLERLLFDAANNDGPKLGSYIISKSGDVIDSVDVGGTKGLNVNVLNELNVDLDYTTDSITAHQGGTWTIDSITNSVTVSATDLDIRDLAYTSDSVTSHQGGTWTIDSITNAVTVSATDLDIRDLAYASDSVTAHQGGTWTIDSITNAVTVTATDLDIRDLTHASDSVKIGDGTDFLAIDGNGKALVFEAPNASILATAVSVVDTATALPTSALSGRSRIQIQNLGSDPIYVGSSAVTTSSGLMISKGATESLEAGSSIAIYGIAAAGKTVACRVLELA